MRIEAYGNPEEMHTTRVCHFYLEGAYKFAMRGEFFQGTFFVPLFFEAAQRSISSLPAQASRQSWRVWSYTMSYGFVMQVGASKAD